MKLLLIVHRDEAALETFVTAVRKEKLCGFTMLETTGVGRIAAKEHYEFSIGSLSKLLEGEKLNNTTLFSLVPEERLERVMTLMHKLLPSFSEPGNGIYAVLDVSQFGGLEEP
ncbi:MAG: hypothetical protein KC422_03390 [Trueperaceae bacterium]|nr:hypothetical protein [Trueperaceae bacterium]